MSYDTIVARIQLLLQGLTSQFPTTDLVTIGDYRKMDSGLDPSKALAVLVPGNFDSDGAAAYQDYKHWDVLLDIFKKYGQAREQTVANFTAMRDAIIEHLDKYPTLNALSGVSQVRVTGEEDPNDVLQKGAGEQVGPTFITQRLRITVTQRVSLTGGEYT